MNLKEILYFSAYCLFLIGASKSFRENGSKVSVYIMGTGVVADFLVTILSQLGIKSLQSNIAGINNVIIFAIIFGVVFVWCLFPIALIFWKKRKLKLFHFLITLIEVCWFIDLLLFIYGIYKFPLNY